MRVLGVDPGLDGALAIHDGASLTVYDMPVVQARSRGRELDHTELARILDAAGHLDHAVLEQAWPRPGEAASRAAKQGATWGAVRGVIAAQFIPITVVSPQKWAKALHVAKGKDASRARASELMPAHAHLWQRKRDDGRAEAALMAVYGLRMLTADAA